MANVEARKRKDASSLSTLPSAKRCTLDRPMAEFLRSHALASAHAGEVRHRNGDHRVRAAALATGQTPGRCRAAAQRNRDWSSRIGCDRNQPADRGFLCRPGKATADVLRRSRDRSCPVSAGTEPGNRIRSTHHLATSAVGHWRWVSVWLPASRRGCTGITARVAHTARGSDRGQARRNPTRADRGYVRRDRSIGHVVSGGFRNLRFHLSERLFRVRDSLCNSSRSRSLSHSFCLA